jgi:predicted lipid-binding transport protein (Tim44 family)
MYTSSDLGLGVANTSAAGGVGLLGGALAGGGIGYKIGAAIGTAAAPGIGTAIGVVLGGLLGTAVGAISGAIATSVSGIESKSEKEAIDAVVEHYSKAENKGMFATSDELKKHLQALKDSGKISKEMAKKLGEDVEALKALTEVEYARLK